MSRDDSRTKDVSVKSDTFLSWVTQTNEVLKSLRTEIVTANGNYGITGSEAENRNAQLIGTFNANVVAVTDFLRGGDVFNSALLTVSSNADFIGANVQIFANLSIENAGGSYGIGITEILSSNTLVESNTYFRYNDNSDAVVILRDTNSPNLRTIDVVAEISTIEGNVEFDTDTLFVDATNNRVGIGNSAPNARFHITSSVADDIIRVDDEASDTTYFVIDDEGKVAIGNTAPAARLHITSAVNEDILRIDDDATDATYIVVNQDGKVAIGNTAPAARLHITSAVNEDILRIDDSATDFTYLVMDDEGNVGIGNTTPLAKVHITNELGIDSFRVDDAASDTTPFVINASGSVGIGTTTPSISNGVAPIIVAEASASYGPQSSWRNTTSDATAGYFHFEKSRGGGLVSASDVVGTLSWRAHDGVDFRGVATISALTGATPAAGDTPGILYFATTAEGASSSTERMRIQSTGFVGINQTDPKGFLHVTTGNTTPGVVITTTSTANAIIVEDSANPDSTPFVVTSDGRVGVGNTTPVAKVHIVNQDAIDSFRVDDQATDTTYFVVSPAGDVGVGTPTPADLVHLQATANPAIRLNTSANTDSYTVLEHDAATQTNFAHYTSVGAPTISVSPHASDGTSVQTIRFFRASNTGGSARLQILEPGTTTVNHVFQDSALNSYVCGVGGDFGVGISAPTAKLHVTNTGSGDSFLVEDSANPDDSPVLVDNSGYFVVGHTASLASSGTAKALIQTHTGTASNYWGGFSATNWAAGSYGGHLTLSNSRSGAKDTHTIVVDDDVLGAVHFAGSDGTQFHPGATISARAEGIPGASDMPGRLTFSTTAAGFATPTERMRIKSTGYVNIAQRLNVGAAVTVTPTDTLDVDGTANISGNTTIGTSASGALITHNTNLVHNVSRSSGFTATADVFTFNKSTYKTARFTAQLSQSSEFQCSDFIVATDGGSDVYITVFGTVLSNPAGGDLGDFSVTTDGTNVIVQCTPTTATTTVATIHGQLFKT